MIILVSKKIILIGVIIRMLSVPVIIVIKNRIIYTGLYDIILL